MRVFFVALIVVSLVVPNFCRAQEAEAEATTPGKIQRVTLYRDQALVTRSIPIAAGNDEREILVGRLPERVVPDSIYAEGNDTVEIRGVRVTQRTPGGADDTKVSELLSQIEELQEQIRVASQGVELNKKQSHYIDQLMSFSVATSHADLNRGVLDAPTLTELTNYSMESQKELGAELLALEQQVVEATTRQAELQAELQLLTQPSSNRYEVRLLVATRDGAAGNIELSYLVSGCGWSPQYTIRGGVGRETFDLRYSALVEQMSGEDWQQVQLTLSTASPSMSAAGPTLIPFRVDVVANGNSGAYGEDPFGGEVPGSDALSSDRIIEQSQQLRQKQQAVQSEYAGKHTELDNLKRDYALNTVASGVQNLELQADSKQLKTLAADVNDEVASQTYAVEKAVSLDSRREQQVVQIIVAELPGELYHVATPLLSTFAYREADIVNTRSEGLLQGPATIYLDDRFVGRTEIPSIASGQHLIVGFGADQQIRTRRELLQKTDQVQGGNRRLTFEYRLVVSNFKDQPVALRLFDRLPLASQASEISVQPAEFQLPISTDGLYQRVQRPRGVLRWDVEIPGGQFGEKAFDVEYSYSMEFDRNRTLNAVVNSEQADSDFMEVIALPGMGGGMGGQPSAPSSPPQP